MKVKILRPYLDYEQGKEYEVKSLANAKYMIAMSIAKEVVGKDGKPVAAKEKVVVEPKKETAKPAAKAKAKPVEKAKVEPIESVEDPDDLMGLFD